MPRMTSRGSKIRAKEKSTGNLRSTPCEIVGHVVYLLNYGCLGRYREVVNGITRY